ncbi:type II CAAX prenyl endopeptidase Rce1 family protein [Planctomycetota bacterium]
MALLFAILGAHLLLRHRDSGIPLTGDDRWLLWILHQFLYIGVAEEFFFRGYIQNNIAFVLHKTSCSNRSKVIFTVVLSSLAFMIAHLLLAPNLLSALTFFPALVMGWLYSDTRCLLPSIIFHGWANICLRLALTISA